MIFTFMLIPQIRLTSVIKLGLIGRVIKGRRSGAIVERLVVLEIDLNLISGTQNFVGKIFKDCCGFDKKSLNQFKYRNCLKLSDSSKTAAEKSNLDRWEEAIGRVYKY